MKFRLFVGQPTPAQLATPNGLTTWHEAPTLVVQADAKVTRFVLEDGRVVLLAGRLVGCHTANGVVQSYSLAALKELLQTNTLAQSRAKLEGRYILLIVSPHGISELGADRYAERDIYCQDLGNTKIFASDLTLLPTSPATQGYDEVGVAHTLVMYGSRPAKRHTLYKDVSRLGVGDVVQITPNQTQVVRTPFNPPRPSSYTERDLHRYADNLLEAVRLRGSTEGNVVYLSSGWDSTSLLACLVHVFGASKVRAVIGRMHYANRTGLINKFEIDRAQAVADYYGIPLEIAEFDYRAEASREWIDRVRPLFKAHHLASVTGINHAVLAHKAAETAKGNEAVFAGEISDGAHNLGFAQFATILEHPVLVFREYSDKMNSYLFGPTFLRLLQMNRYADDAVYGLLRGRTKAAFESLATKDNGSITLQLLSSFFLRAGRLPLLSLENVPLLNPRGREVYRAEMERVYLQEASERLEPETLYAWYLHLYNSFHWQSSTVATLPLTVEAHHLQPALPFWDSRVQDFLAGMPEDWGRGLDFHPTKYPLKWMLQNRIDYPMHLQIGPHSYLYDVDPSFSHSAELLYGSGLATYFKELLRGRAYQQLLSAQLFNLEYVEQIVARYVAGTEVRGAELNDLASLCWLSMIGWY